MDPADLIVTVLSPPTRDACLIAFLLIAGLHSLLELVQKFQSLLLQRSPVPERRLPYNEKTYCNRCRQKLRGQSRRRRKC